QDGGAASICSSGGQRVGCQMNFGPCVQLECVDINSLCLGGIQLARECLCVLAETGTLEVTHFILKVSQGNCRSLRGIRFRRLDTDWRHGGEVGKTHENSKQHGTKKTEEQTPDREGVVGRWE